MKTIPQRRRLRAFPFTLLLTVVLVACGEARASTISGDGALGDFTGTFTYLASDANNATLTITLNNTSPPSNGGYLTDFVFNNPGNKITGVVFDGDDDFPAFTFIPGTSPASPFGDFDFLVSATGAFNGGGSPKGGIPEGESATFVFTLTGNMLDTLSEAAFASELSSNPQGGGNQAFVVRFRGFDDDGSDKVVGQFGVLATPVPPSLVLMSVGGLGLALARRWGNRRPAA